MAWADWVASCRVMAIGASPPASRSNQPGCRIGCGRRRTTTTSRASRLPRRACIRRRSMKQKTYDNNIAGVTIAPPGVYPTPLYEAAMALVLAWLLWTLRSHRHRAGFLFAVYLIFAGFERLLIEKIRVNARYSVLDFAVTQAQAISFALVLAGCIAAFVTLRRSLLPRV